MISLNNRTAYSFLRGYGLPEQWQERCEQIGVEALGVADYCSVWGHIPFSKIATKVLYGVQVPVVNRLEKDPRHALVSIYARKDISQINEALTLAYTQTYYRPRLTWSQLADFDVEIVVDDCPLTEIANFAKLERGYLGLGPYPSLLHKAAPEFDCVLANGAKYPFPEDKEAYNILNSISQGHRIGEVETDEIHLLRVSEHEALFRQFGIEPQECWIQNSKKIAENCNAQIKRATNLRLEGDIERLAVQGAERLGIELTGAYQERLQRELSAVRDKDFDSYFLFVADLVDYARGHMLVGPGRGSAGGSLLCYLLGITNVNPLEHGTLFERFIDVGRSDYPDIDVDFPDNKRELVFQYLADKYGKEHVARLGTISKLGGKSAINDVAKAFGIPYAVARDVGRGYEGLSVPLPVYFKNLPDELQTVVNEHPDLVKAGLIDGMPRHSGVHAAGVVVTNEPVTDFGSVSQEGVISVDLHTAEDVNLLKMDALGLRTLSVLEDANKNIGQDLTQLTLDDPRVYQVFNDDHVTGVFQFEGQAVRGLMKRMKVERFDDLCALTSLARPGPLVGGAAENYVARRAGEVDWDYLAPPLEAHTKETYGTIVYQEQAMSIVRDLGGFDPIEVNKFRKAVGKKDPETLGNFREKFLEKAAPQIGSRKADDLWDEMCEFGSYAFNKSHAVAYSMISYWCAWFKAYHPLEFALAQLNNAADDAQGKAILRELNEEGYEYVTFDAHKSSTNWSVIDGKLYGGFTSVKGIGQRTAEKMIEIRDEFGEDWLCQLTDAQRNKLETNDNTPWDDLNRMRRWYHEIYDSPREYRSESLPKGLSQSVLTIDEIPDQKGTYIFIGKMLRRQMRQNKAGKDFCNLYFEDDTGDVGCTINQFKWRQFTWLMEDNYDGCDFVVKGNIINEDGRKWLFIENLVQLQNDDRREVNERDRKEPSGTDGKSGEEPSQDRAGASSDAGVHSDSAAAS